MPPGWKYFEKVLNYMMRYSKEWKCPWYEDESDLRISELFSTAGATVPGVGKNTWKAGTPVAHLYSQCFKNDLEDFVDYLTPQCVESVKVSCRAACLVLYCKVCELLDLDIKTLDSLDDEASRTAAFILYTGKTDFTIWDGYGNLASVLESELNGDLPTCTLEPREVVTRVVYRQGKGVQMVPVEVPDFEDLLKAIRAKIRRVTSFSELCEVYNTHGRYLSQETRYGLDKLLDCLSSRIDRLFPGLPKGVVGEGTGFDYLYELVVRKENRFVDLLPSSVFGTTGGVTTHVLRCLFWAFRAMDSPKLNLNTFEEIQVWWNEFSTN